MTTLNWFCIIAVGLNLIIHAYELIIDFNLYNLNKFGGWLVAILFLASSIIYEMRIEELLTN